MMNESTICQSCGMPLNDPNLLGSELNGSQSNEYCKYCYEDGAFTQPNLTIEGMKEICLPFMKESGMKEEEAKTILNNLLPNLKRWRG